MSYLRKIYIALLGLMIGVFAITCSSDYVADNAGANANVKMSFVHSTLANSVATVVLHVIVDETAALADTAAVVNGEFSFGTLTLPVGQAIFQAKGLSGAGVPLYQGSATATITSGANTEVNLELVPAIPMTKLSPYFTTISNGSMLTSTLELYGLQRFYNGSFHFSYNPSLLRFESVVESYANQWGGLIHFSHEEHGDLVVSVSRTGETDVVPSNLHALIDLQFTALAPGTAKLSLEIDSLENLDGRVAEFNSVFVDTQTVVIQ